MRRLLSLLVAAFVLAASGCATYTLPARLVETKLGAEEAQYVADAVRSVNRAVAPLPLDVVADVEPTDDGVLATVLQGFTQDQWTPENAQAPPAELAISTLKHTRPRATYAQSNPSFVNWLQTTLVPQYSTGSSTATFTRASTAYGFDFENRAVLYPSGAARMQGARVVQQLLTGGASFATQSVTTIAGTYALSFDAASTGTITLSGTASGTLVGDGASVKGKVFTTTAGTLTLTLSVGTGVNVLLENLTGVTNSNPSDVYVDDATSYGAGINGARYSANLNASTLSGSNLTRATGAAINSSNAKFAVLPGVAGSYFSTPNAAANQITGVIDIRVDIAPNSWTPGIGIAGQNLVSKVATDGQSAYDFGIVATTGYLVFRYTNTGAFAGLKTATSSAATGFSAGTRAKVRVTYAAATGKANFYTSTDGGTTWTALGTEQTITAGSIFAGSDALSIGATTSSSYLGNIYRAQIYNGINGTLAVDFNPNLSTSAQTFTAATGEVWTTNGTAIIFGNTSATYGIPAQWDANGPFGYLAEGARADVLGTTAAIRRTMTDVGWVCTNITVATTTGIDGTAASAARLTATGANGTCLFTPGLAGAIRTFSSWCKRINGTGATSYTVDVADGYVAKTLTTAYAQYQTTSSSAVPVVGYKIATSGDVIDCDFATLEAATFANPTPIPVNVSKAADVLLYAANGNIDGTNGSSYLELQIPSVAAVTTDMRVLDSQANSHGPHLLQSAVGQPRIFDGTTYATSGLPAINFGSVNKLGASWGGASMQEFSNGAAGNVQVFNGNMGFAGSNIELGTTGGSVQIFGTIRRVQIWPVALSSPRLILQTTDASYWLNPNNWMLAANDDAFRLVANK